MQTVTDAFTYALKKHSGQYRDDGSTPYIVHPFRVFLWIADEAKVYDEAVLAAAFLHDLIEDTKTDYDDIEEEFGKEIAGIVSAVTKDRRLPEKEREKRFNQHLSTVNWKAKVVKLSDIYDNLSDMKNSRKKDREKRSKIDDKLGQLKFLEKNLPAKYRPLVALVRQKAREVRASLK